MKGFLTEVSFVHGMFGGGTKLALINFYLWGIYSVYKLN